MELVRLSTIVAVLAVDDQQFVSRAQSPTSSPQVVVAAAAGRATVLQAAEYLVYPLAQR
jgi:hypothetical protein